MLRPKGSTLFAALACAAVLSWGHQAAAASHGGGSHGGGGFHGGSHGGGSFHGGSHGGFHSSSHGGGFHGGGSHGGGSHSWGGHGGGSWGHGGGSWGHGGGSWGHGGSWSHGGHFHGGYYPYYGYPWWGWAYWGSPWGWGWGWGYGPWYGYGYPYYGDGYSYGGGYGRGDYGAANFAIIKTDVQPDEASVYLDGKLIGTADDFDGYPDTLYLGPGNYHLEFRLPGYETLTSDVDASPGRFFRIDNRLKKIPGASQYGTYTPEEPPGGVVRYFQKQEGGNGDIPAEREQGRQPYGRPDMRMQPGDDQAPPSDFQERWDGGGRMPEPRDQPVSAQPVPPEPSPAPAAAAGDARIVFEVSPPDAAVYVDDHFAGSARELNVLSGGLPVPEGEHRVTVTCPGYRETAMHVNASRSDLGRVTISLKK